MDKLIYASFMMDKSDLEKFLDKEYKRLKRRKQMDADIEIDGALRAKAIDLYHLIMRSMTNMDVLLEQGLRSIYELECITIQTLQNQLYDTLIERRKFLEKSSLGFKYESVEELICFKGH